MDDRTLEKQFKHFEGVIEWAAQRQATLTSVKDRESFIQKQKNEFKDFLRGVCDNQKFICSEYIPPMNRIPSHLTDDIKEADYPNLLKPQKDESSNTT